MLLQEDSFDSSAIERAAYDCAEKALFVFFKSIRRRRASGLIPRYHKVVLTV